MVESLKKQDKENLSIKASKENKKGKERNFLDVKKVCVWSKYKAISFKESLICCNISNSVYGKTACKNNIKLPQMILSASKLTSWKSTKRKLALLNYDRDDETVKDEDNYNDSDNDEQRKGMVKRMVIQMKVWKMEKDI